MADETSPGFTIQSQLSRRILGGADFVVAPAASTLSPKLVQKLAPRFFPDVTLTPGRAPTPAQPAPPAPVQPAVPAAAQPAAAAPAPPAPLPPVAPAGDPFAQLPLPNAGDRIKSEDFRRLSQALGVLADAYALAGAAFGRPFGQVRVALAAQGYEVARVVSVRGAELAHAQDTSLDGRKVTHVAPLALGGRQVGVVVTDEGGQAVRTMPNLVGLTYREASARLQEQVGDLVGGGGPLTVPDFVGRTLSEAQRSVSG